MKYIPKHSITIYKHMEGASCRTCKRDSSSVCTGCGVARYCDKQCQRQDWARHKAVCSLIQAKTKRADGGEEEEEPVKMRRVKKDEAKDMCANESDPFNLDDFADMDPKFIFVIDRHCFHLPSLYDWVVNRDINRNPMTNLPLSDFDVERLTSTAAARFPLLVRARRINTTKEFHTTSLITVERLLPMILPALGEGNTETLYQTALALRYKRMVVVVGQERYTFVEAVSRVGNVQLLNLTDADSVQVLVFGLTPPSHEDNNNRLRDLALARGWPSQDFAQAALEARQFFRALDRVRERDIRLMPRAPVPSEEQDRNRPPGTIKVGFIFNLRGGEERGPEYLYLPRDAELRSAEPELRVRGEDYFQMPQEPMQFVYAGRFYSGERFLYELPIEDGAVMYVTWR